MSWVYRWGLYRHHQTFNSVTSSSKGSKSYPWVPMAMIISHKINEVMGRARPWPPICSPFYRTVGGGEGQAQWAGTGGPSLLRALWRVLWRFLCLNFAALSRDTPPPRSRACLVWGGKAGRCLECCVVGEGEERKKSCSLTSFALLRMVFFFLKTLFWWIWGSFQMPNWHLPTFHSHISVKNILQFKF